MRLASRLPRTPLAGLCLSLLLAGCSTGSVPGSDGGDADDGDDAGDDVPAGPCELPEYGDGICQTDLACAQPDIDCFTTFATQAEGEAFFLRFEELLAAQEGRAPRSLVPSTDPRFARMRTLLDQGWLAYQQVNPVGDLADVTPALVVVQDPNVNAFVIPDIDTGKAGLAVMVHSATLDQNASDQAMLGLVMHELEHSLGLHVVGDTDDRIRRFYVAGDQEPLGFQQDEDPIARQHGVAWRTYAGEAGPFRQEELGGLPLGRDNELSRIFNPILEQASADPACGNAINQLGAVTNEIGSTFSTLEVDIRITDPSVRGRVDAAMAALRDQCLAGFTSSFVDVVAAQIGISADQMRARLEPSDLELVEGVHFVDAIQNLALDRRAKMRAAEAAFTQQTGRPFSSLRFFSYEEAADDATVPVLDDIGLAADGLGEFLFDIQDSQSRNACGQILNAGQTPPYGADLADEHHATCWRVAHVEQLAASGAVTQGGDGGQITRTTAALRRRAPLPRIPRLPRVPRPLSDLVMH